MGLVACSDDQFNKGNQEPVACPAESKIGTVEVDTPPLPDGSLNGTVFLGRQLSRDPASGRRVPDLRRRRVDRYGISARLIGKVSADPQTGQLTTTFDDGPLGSVPIPGLPGPVQLLPAELDGGAESGADQPAHLRPEHQQSTRPMVLGAGHGPSGSSEGPSTDPPAGPSANFALSAAPRRRPLSRKRSRERPFAPGFSPTPTSPKAGAFSPLRIDITRSDGEQELKGVDVPLPPGLTAKLAGVRYCPEAALAAAAANSGAAEAASPSCPATSLVGSASVNAGSGPAPLQIEGKVFLAGPYQGAPLSLAVDHPRHGRAVRSRHGRGEGGAVRRPAKRRRSTPSRTRSPTSSAAPCSTSARSTSSSTGRTSRSTRPTARRWRSAATLRGGGADPPTRPPSARLRGLGSVPGRTAARSSASGRSSHLRLFGGTRRAKNPKLRAVLVARDGDANIGRAAVTLPRSLILDQATSRNVCTRVAVRRPRMPEELDLRLRTRLHAAARRAAEGPVYLRSSDNPLPDLVAALQRPGRHRPARARSTAVNGRIRDTFDTVPDVPVSKFVADDPRRQAAACWPTRRNLCSKQYRGKQRTLRSRRPDQGPERQEGQPAPEGAPGVPQGQPPAGGIGRRRRR